MRTFSYTLLAASLIAAIITASSYADDATAFNPSSIPPWGVGPAPEITTNTGHNPPVSNAPSPVPPVPTITAPTKSDRFTVYNADGSTIDVTGKVFILVDEKTGTQFIVFIAPGSGIPVMVRR